MVYFISGNVKLATIMIVWLLFVKHEILKNLYVFILDWDYLRWEKPQREVKACIWHQDQSGTKLQSYPHRWTTLVIDQTIVLISSRFVTHRWKIFRNLYPYQRFPDCWKLSLIKSPLKCSLQQEQLIIGPLIKSKRFLSASHILKIGRQ